MIVTTRAGNRSVEGRAWVPYQPSIPTWTDYIGLSAASGVQVTLAKAMGLPSVGVAIKLLAESVGALPLLVFEGEEATKRKAKDSWQWRLLYDQPNPDCSAFDFRSDIAASIETCGNAFAEKVKVNGEVLALYVIDPSDVIVKRDDRGRKVFDVFQPDSPERRRRLSAAQVLHVRGFTPKGGDVGISPIAQYANAIGTGLAGQEFQGNFFANDATPSSYLSVPGRMTRAQARELKDIWTGTQGGVSNAGKLGVLFDGTELKVPGIPLRDAQFVESQTFSAALAARIFLGPAASLLGENPLKTEEESLRFLNFALLPRLRRIEAALAVDPDLFPDGGGLYPEFKIDEFLRADAATRAEVQHKQIQSGVLLVDEARAAEGRPPLPDGVGQVPQITPVGGAPNPALTPPAPAPAEE